ncbi:MULTISPECIES: methyl-accepting chemotaxis protein [unclassified Rhizobium]|uniref:methyl-accepting chemotaxis protein n=1 Tax=unclassified Rhizobium TaxID=2613769 RepID=UPI001AE7A8BF|nr:MULTISPECIES: methyl-accepting chemotaxis protein [unclassified Rhizobium]MBP2461796.1 methyl-accepting chemotaxis protein [Rhizobium sp. PvP014]MBP2529191.1 methyl-accepting chemotaxis protein [Rhizobium sp. PvP099]
MSFLKNASIRTKILSVLIPLCVVGLSATSFVASRYKAADTSYSDFISSDNVAAVEFVRVNRNLAASGYAAYQILTYSRTDPAMTTAIAFYKESKTALLMRLDTVQAGLASKMPEVNGIAIRVKEALALIDKAVEAGSSDRDEEARALLAQADLQIMPLGRDMVTLLDRFNKGIAQTSDEMTETTNALILKTLAALVVIFALGIIASLIIATKGITKPIASLRERMASLARGETEAPVEGQDRRDELGAMAAAVAVFRDNALERIRLEREADANRSLSDRERIERDAQKAKDAADTQFAVDQLAGGLAKLAQGDVAYRLDTPFVAHLDALRNNFNDSVANLQETLQAVGNNARGIDGGANEIRAAADDLSKRTEQQAASVEETAAALEQITTTVKDSSKRAEEVGNLVTKARAGAERSGAVVRDAVTAMQGIEKSSGEISSIIGVIDEIAFQTNLLALNAGVEAARAGEAGKGFAVVAQEVRELAQRSAKAAKEIKELITASSEHVRSGVHLVGETGKALEVIVAEVQEINRHVNAIVDSAREQAVGLQEINTAVNTMDQGTQQNAAMVEESTAASHSLAKEAASLNDLLSRFNLGQGENRSASNGRRGHAPSGPMAVSPASRQTPSPARALGNRIASAFGGGSSSAAAQAQSWEEF